MRYRARPGYRKTKWSAAVTRQITATAPAVCRVCRMVIPRGTSVLHKDWGVEYAHVECGWEGKTTSNGPHPG